MPMLRSPLKARSAAYVVVRHLSALSLCLVFGLTACDSGGSGSGGKKVGAGSKATASKGKGECVSGDTTPTWLATRDFVKSSSPTPQRFLSAAGTDSELPDDGMKALKDKGPTYFYAGTDNDKKKLLAKLDDVGPFATLLVVMRGETKNADGSMSVRLGGHYVGGQLNGKAGDSRAYTFACDSTGWKMTNKQDEKAP